MNAPKGPAAPASGTSSLHLDDITDDPDIAELLDFEPVPRRAKKEGGWTPDLQRLFIARLAVHGSPGKACKELGMFRSGVDKLCDAPGSESFREAWAAAVALAERRRAEYVAAGHASTVGPSMPFVDNRRKPPKAAPQPLPGQVMNERGEWEDPESLEQRGQEAARNICNKLLRCRRLYLYEISDSPGKRAAFEILTELPVDWDKAARMEEQPDEPWNPVRMRSPDMILTAESGWSFGELGYGPDRKAEMRQAMNDYLAEQGLEPIDWDESADPLPAREREG